MAKISHYDFLRYDHDPQAYHVSFSCWFLLLLLLVTEQ